VLMGSGVGGSGSQVVAEWQQVVWKGVGVHEQQKAMAKGRGKPCKRWHVFRERHGMPQCRWNGMKRLCPAGSRWYV